LKTAARHKRSREKYPNLKKSAQQKQQQPRLQCRTSGTTHIPLHPDRRSSALKFRGSAAGPAVRRVAGYYLW
jgi:hypothetical protein